MTTITIDDEMINELVAVSHFKNAQEAVIKILADTICSNLTSSPP